MSRAEADASSTITKLLRTAVALSALLVGLWVTYYRLGTSFSRFGDEGYVLLSIKNYIAGDRLYTQLFSQYGPVFYFIQSGLFHALHQPLTHDGGRRVTLLLWIASALCGALVLYRLSRSVILASATWLAMMLIGASFVAEPNHPEHIILLLLILACCVALSPGAIWFGVLGGLGAALLLIKINIGLFFLVALFATLLCMLPTGLLRRVGAIAFTAYFLFAPIALMRRDLHSWARGFCALEVLGGTAAFLTALVTSPRSSGARKQILYAAAGALILSIVVVAATMMQGMSLSTLLDGVLIAPLRQPQVFEVPQHIFLWAIVPVTILVAGIGILYLSSRRAQRSVAWIALVRAAAGAYIVVEFALTLHISPFPVLLFVPLALLRPDSDEWTLAEYMPRLFITLLAAAEILEDYPVVAPQLSDAAGPVILWSLLCIYDGIRELMRRFPDLARPKPSMPSTLTLVGALLIFCAEAQLLRGGLWKMRFFSPASSLSGSASIHLPRETEDTYVGLVTDVRRNCDMLYTLPGMNSLNLWSGVPTPNGFNLTAWVKGFSAGQQREILYLLQSDTNACVIVNPTRGSEWGTTDADLAASPLAGYILRNMRLASTVHAYEIRVNPLRTQPWIQTP